MLATTLDIIRSGLKADPTVTPGDRARILATLRNGTPAPLLPPHFDAPRIVRRNEAAQMLSGSTRFVDRLAQQGALKKVKLPGRTRCAGFLEADIRALMTG